MAKHQYSTCRIIPQRSNITGCKKLCQGTFQSQIKYYIYICAIKWENSFTTFASGTFTLADTSSISSLQTLTVISLKAIYAAAQVLPSFTRAYQVIWRRYILLVLVKCAWTRFQLEHCTLSMLQQGILKRYKMHKIGEP